MLCCRVMFANNNYFKHIKKVTFESSGSSRNDMDCDTPDNPIFYGKDYANLKIRYS